MLYEQFSSLCREEELEQSLQVEDDFVRTEFELGHRGHVRAQLGGTRQRSLRKCVPVPAPVGVRVRALASRNFSFIM